MLDELHFGAAVGLFLFRQVAYILCLVNIGTDCFSNHLQWTTDITKPPCPLTYHLTECLPLYPLHQTLTAKVFLSHKRKWPQNFRRVTPPLGEHLS